MTQAQAHYDDVLLAEHAIGDDAALMAQGTHYDYRAQAWRDGHDHAHCVSSDESAPLMFCGADVATCSPLTDPALWDGSHVHTYVRAAHGAALPGRFTLA